MITETWLLGDISDNVLIQPSYKIFRHYRQTRRGGVVVVIKSAIECTSLHAIVDIECLCLKLYLSGTVFLLHAVYRPPDLSPVLFI